MSKYFEVRQEDEEAIETFRANCTGETLVIVLKKPWVQLLQLIVEGKNGRSKDYVDSLFTTRNIEVLERRGLIRPVKKVVKENEEKAVSYVATALGLHALAFAEAAQYIFQRGAEVKSIGSRKRAA